MKKVRFSKIRNFIKFPNRMNLEFELSQTASAGYIQDVLSWYDKSQRDSHYAMMYMDNGPSRDQWLCFPDGSSMVAEIHKERDMASGTLMCVHKYYADLMGDTPWAFEFVPQHGKGRMTLYAADEYAYTVGSRHVLEEFTPSEGQEVWKP